MRNKFIVNIHYKEIELFKCVRNINRSKTDDIKLTTFQND